MLAKVYKNKGSVPNPVGMLTGEVATPDNNMAPLVHFAQEKLTFAYYWCVHGGHRSSVISWDISGNHEELIKKFCQLNGSLS